MKPQITEFNNFKLYQVDAQYLKYLAEHEPEVYYNPGKTEYPYVGIIINLDVYTYFIPLVPIQPKHKKLPYITADHFLIYSIKNKTSDKTNYDKSIWKNTSKGQDVRLLAILDLKKMIPVPETCYSEIDFKALADLSYRKLLSKQYKCLKKLRSHIQEKTETLYFIQKQTNKILPMYCNFSTLEQAYQTYLDNFYANLS